MSYGQGGIPLVRVTLSAEQSHQLRFLQEHISPTPTLTGMVEAAVAIWVANQTDDVGIPGAKWRVEGQRAYRTDEPSSGPGPRLLP